MTFLFKSSNCHACTESLINKVRLIYPELKLIDVRYDNETGKYLAFENDIQLGDESPVTVTPSLFLADTNELYTGAVTITKKLEERTNAS